jgi:hypothetical protein
VKASETVGFNKLIETGRQVGGTSSCMEDWNSKVDRVKKRG